MSSLLDSSIKHEFVISSNYVRPNDEYEKKLKEVTSLVAKQVKVIGEGVIVEAMEVVSLANVYSLQPENQKLYLKIIDYLNDQSIDFCRESTRKIWEKSLLLFNESNCVEKALGDFSIFLTTAHDRRPVSPHDLEIACTLMTFAVKFFYYLSEKQQVQFIHTYYVSKCPPLPYRTSPYELEIRSRVTKIFDKFSLAETRKKLFSLPSATPPVQSYQASIAQAQAHLLPTAAAAAGASSGALAPSVATAEDDDGVLIYQKEMTSLQATVIQTSLYEQKLAESGSIQDKLRLLTEIFYDFIIHYTALGSQKGNPAFKPMFEGLFPSFAKRLLIRTPRLATSEELNFVQTMITHLGRFLADINQKRLILAELDLKAVHARLGIALHNLMNKIASQASEESLTKEPFFAWFTSIIGAESISYSIKPYHLYLILNHLLEDAGEPLQYVGHDNIPVANFPSDKAINERLGQAIVHVARELAGMASRENKGNLPYIFQTLLKLIDKNQLLIAQALQQATHRFKKNSLTPLLPLSAHQLLFKKGQTGYSPVFHESHQEPSPEELSEKLSYLEVKLSEKLFKLMKSGIKEQSTIASWLTDKTTFKTTFHALFDQLWQIATSEGGMKILLTYLIEGAFAELSKQQDQAAAASQASK